MKTQSITVELPEDLVEKLRAYVADGWAASPDAVIAEATSRYLWSHRPEVLEKMFMEDVEWGLRGGK